MTRLLAALLWCGAAFGQTGAIIDVRITASGCGLSTALITLWPPGRTEQSVDGNPVRFEELTPGHYTLEIAADGYRTLDTSCVLNAGEYLLFSVPLERIAATLHEVTVETNAEHSGLRHFSRLDILNSRAADLPAFLELEAGLEIQRDGTNGSPSTVRIGGSNTNQVLILVDGRPIQQTGNGTGDLTSIPLEWIESVTLHRGGQTARGAEAIGGIVDISTRISTESAELAFAGETYPTYQRISLMRVQRVGTYGGLFSYVQTQGPGNFRYRISADDGTGDFTPNLGATFLRENSDVRRDQVLIKFEGGSRSVGQAALTGQFDRAARGMPGYLAPQLTPLARQQTTEHALNLRTARSGKLVALASRFSFQDDRREFRNPDPFSRVSQAFESSRRTEGELQAKRYDNRRSLQAGLLAGTESLHSEQIAGGSAGRDRWSAWMLGQQALLGGSPRQLQLEIEPGIRWEGFGNRRAALPRVAVNLAYAPAYQSSAQFAWGRSYRAPTFYSLFWVDDQVSAGNPDLAPEVSAEVSGRLTFTSTAHNPLRFEASASDQRIRDLIFWKKNFDNRWKPFNLKAAHVQTLDVRIEQSLARETLRVHAGANWTEARDATEDRNTGGKYLTFRAPRTFRAGGIWTANAVRISAAYRYIAARPVLESNSKWLAAYSLLDADLSYGFRLRRLRIEAAVGVNNLLNENYRIIRHAPMPLREWHAGLRLSQL